MKKLLLILVLLISIDVSHADDSTSIVVHNKDYDTIMCETTSPLDNKCQVGNAFQSGSEYALSAEQYVKTQGYKKLIRLGTSILASNGKFRKFLILTVE